MTSGELLHSMQSNRFRDCTQRLIHPSIHGSVHYDTCLFTRRLLLLEHFRKSIHGRSYLFLKSFLFVLGNSVGHKTINSIRSVEGSNWDWSVKWTNRNPIPNFSRIHLWSSMKRQEAAWVFFTGFCRVLIQRCPFFRDPGHSKMTAYRFRYGWQACFWNPLRSVAGSPLPKFRQYATT